jgi:cation-transporting ATPase 13A3/4/5
MSNWNTSKQTNQKETKVNYLYGSTNYQESLQSPLASTFKLQSSASTSSSTTLSPSPSSFKQQKQRGKLRYRSKQLDWSDSEDDFNNQEESSFLLSEMDHDNNHDPEKLQVSSDTVQIHDFNSPKNSDEFNRNTTFIPPNAAVSQKFDLESDDLYITVTGYRTNQMKWIGYILLCIFTLGIGYLVLRWLPKRRIRMVGEQVELDKAEWLVVEVILFVI